MRRRFRSYPLVALAASLVVGVNNPLAAQDYAACVQEKLANFHLAPETFSSEGEVVCPAAEGSPAAPNARRFDTTSLFTYEAPAGYQIVPGSVSVQVLASDMGSNQPPQVEGNRVLVPMACQGKDVGQGEAFHRIRVTGTMQVPITEQTRAEALADCQRCSGRTSC
jgi:hypothetical protein